MIKNIKSTLENCTKNYCSLEFYSLKPPDTYSRIISQENDRNIMNPKQGAPFLENIHMEYRCDALQVHKDFKDLANELSSRFEFLLRAAYIGIYINDKVSPRCYSMFFDFLDEKSSSSLDSQGKADAYHIEENLSLETVLERVMSVEAWVRSSEKYVRISRTKVIELKDTGTSYWQYPCDKFYMRIRVTSKREWAFDEYYTQEYDEQSKQFIGYDSFKYNIEDDYYQLPYHAYPEFKEWELSNSYLLYMDRHPDAEFISFQIFASSVDCGRNIMCGVMICTYHLPSKDEKTIYVPLRYIPADTLEKEAKKIALLSWDELEKIGKADIDDELEQFISMHNVNIRLSVFY